MANPWSEIGRLCADGETVTVVTVTGTRGSVPGEVGAKMVVGANGRMLGTVGGGKVEAKASVPEITPLLIAILLQLMGKSVR